MLFRTKTWLEESSLRQSPQKRKNEVSKNKIYSRRARRLSQEVPSFFCFFVFVKSAKACFGSSWQGSVLNVSCLHFFGFYFWSVFTWIQLLVNNICFFGNFWQPYMCCFLVFLYLFFGSTDMASFFPIELPYNERAVPEQSQVIKGQFSSISRLFNNLLRSFLVLRRMLISSLG